MCVCGWVGVVVGGCVHMCVFFSGRGGLQGYMVSALIDRIVDFLCIDINSVFLFSIISLNALGVVLMLSLP